MDREILRRRLATLPWVELAAILALGVIVVVAIVPFFLSHGFLIKRFPVDTTNSSAVRALTQQLTLVEEQIASLDKEKKALNDLRHQLFESCRRATNDVANARIQGVVHPDCVNLRYGSTDDLGLKNAQMKSANDLVGLMMKNADESKSIDSRIDKARQARAETFLKIDAARVEATRLHSSQIDLFLLLMRYGSLGALGAIGFNIVLRLGVFQEGASKPPRVPMVATIIYLIGSMVVAAILAVIFVPRFVDIPDSAGSFFLTPSGISYAAAAGLVGDVALSTLKRLFKEPATS